MTLDCYNLVCYGCKRLLLQDILESAADYPKLFQITVPAF